MACRLLLRRFAAVYPAAARSSQLENNNQVHVSQQRETPDWEDSPTRPGVSAGFFGDAEILQCRPAGSAAAQDSFTFLNTDRDGQTVSVWGD